MESIALNALILEDYRKRHTCEMSAQRERQYIRNMYLLLFSISDKDSPRTISEFLNVLVPIYNEASDDSIHADNFLSVYCNYCMQHKFSSRGYKYCTFLDFSTYKHNLEEICFSIFSNVKIQGEIASLLKFNQNEDCSCAYDTAHV